MSADVLREAAASMRARAEAARSWWPSDEHDGMDESPWMDAEWWSAVGLSGAAVHAASWHPAVALAVADWLDAAVETDCMWHRALAVAHAYLGTSDA